MIPEMITDEPSTKVVDGKTFDYVRPGVYAYTETGQHRRDMEHADRVASRLAENTAFIQAIADAIMNTPVSIDQVRLTINKPDKEE